MSIKPKKFPFKKTNKQGTIYEQMTKNLEEIYYRKIVKAHESDIKARVQRFVDDVIHQVSKGYLSAKEAYQRIDAEKKGVIFIDSVLKTAPARIRLATQNK